MLAKVGSAKNVKDMYSNEYMYFNTFERFRQGEKDEAGRNDRREGNLYTTQLTYLSVKVGDKTYELSEKALKFQGQYNEHLDKPKINICSLLHIKFDDKLSIIPFDQKVLEFGEQTMLIYEPNRFLEILDEQLESMNYEYSRRLVEYYDPNQHNGELSMHHKDFAFQWQQEYRILIAPEGVKPVKIPIPKLKEISTIIDTGLAKCRAPA